MIIRFAKPEDLPQIVEIINQATRVGNANAFHKELESEEKRAWLEAHDEDHYPLYVLEWEGKVIAWASLSPYRGRRAALRKVAEISYYVDYVYHGQGIGKQLMKHAIADCERLGFEHLVALLIEINTASIRLLEKFGFERWGFLPDVVELKDTTCGHLIYGKNLGNAFALIKR